MNSDGTYGIPAQRTPNRSVISILACVIPQVLEPTWTPESAAKELVERAGARAYLLRATRRHLLCSTSRRTSIVDLRVLATLNMAIAEIEAVAAA